MLADRIKILMSVAPLITIVFSGCHCMGISERYGNVIDRVADQQLCFDNCYRPGLDLTRLCRGCVHQEAMVRNIGFYPNDYRPSTVSEEPAGPPVEGVDPAEQDDYSPLPPPPVPPVPAAELPVIDINTISEISNWSPKQFQSSGLNIEPGDGEVIQSSGTEEPNSIKNEFKELTLAPLESIEALPVNVGSDAIEPLSTPGTVPPSQKFYNAKLKQ